MSRRASGEIQQQEKYADRPGWARGSTAKKTFRCNSHISTLWCSQSEGTFSVKSSRKRISTGDDAVRVYIIPKYTLHRATDNNEEMEKMLQLSLATTFEDTIWHHALRDTSWAQTRLIDSTVVWMLSCKVAGAVEWWRINNDNQKTIKKIQKWKCDKRKWQK